MLSFKTAVYLAPPIAANVVEFLNDGDAAPHVTVENLDALASAAIKLRESSGSTWSDIAGSSRTINPGESVSLDAVSALSRLALHAGGNVRLLVNVKRQVNGAPTNLGSA